MTKNSKNKKPRHHHTPKVAQTKKGNPRMQRKIDEAVHRVLEEYGEVIRKLGKE